MIKAQNFQALASEQGTEFRDLCRKSLIRAGFTEIHTEKTFEDVGVTLDIIAMNQEGISLAIECKGSMMGDRPGCKRTDTVLKAVGEAFLLSRSEAAPMFPPMLLMTSHVATSGAARTMLGSVPVSVIADVLNPYNHAKTLLWWAQATEQAIVTHIERYGQVEDLLLLRWHEGKVKTHANQ